jgi:GxxExxY protein
MEKINADILYADLTYKIRSAVFNVYNELGFGHKESLYQNALENEFSLQKIPYEQQVQLKVKYKGNYVGDYRPDFVVDRKVVVEIKALEFMPNMFETQLIHYLKTTGYNLGLLVNFGSPKLYIKRLIWTGNARLSNP